ncbi:MAG: class II aldolase/adducin family protein [Dehalococcoidia bacterium]|nr:class II aldolase/adducin family protein [Dehalococcoidia bacterium]
MSAWQSEKQTVLEAARKMAERGFVVGTSGNISMRLKEPGGRELVAITPNNRHYDSMEADDIGIVDLEGQLVEGELTTSIETMLHTGIYKARKKVNAVIHTHPVFSSVFSVAGLEIPPILDDQITYLGGEIKVAAYSLPGSQELVSNVVPALGPRNAVILANHGALTVGRDMREAFVNTEMLEKTVIIYLYALGLGKINTVPPVALEMEQAYFNYLYGEDQ